MPYKITAGTVRTKSSKYSSDVDWVILSKNEYVCLDSGKVSKEYDFNEHTNFHSFWGHLGSNLDPVSEIRTIDKVLADRGTSHSIEFLNDYLAKHGCISNVCFLYTEKELNDMVAWFEKRKLGWQTEPEICSIIKQFKLSSNLVNVWKKTRQCVKHIIGREGHLYEKFSFGKLLTHPEGAELVFKRFPELKMLLKDIFVDNADCIDTIHGILFSETF